MKPSILSFLVGIATALAIAAGFAGAFMENTALRRGNDVALRGAPSTVTAPMAPVVRVGSAPQGWAAPSTSGIALPAPMLVPDTATTRPGTGLALPKSAAAPALPGDASTHGAGDAPQSASPDQARKSAASRPKPKRKKRPEWYEDQAIAARRNNHNPFFNLFR